MTVKSYLFDAWRRHDQEKHVTHALWLMIAILLVINLGMLIGWKSAPSVLRVYIPPNIEQGALLTPNVIPKSTLYAFAYQIFSSLNSWTTEGKTDYLKNIEAYKNYLSVNFYQYLIADQKARAQNGELNRQRIISGVSDMGYTPADVVALGNHVWQVDLHLHIVETVESSVVKDVIMDYPLIIAQVNEAITVNPWGLVIQGFDKEPTRIKTLS